jgi:hypothetical protein
VAIFGLGLVAAGLLGMAGWHAETSVAEMTPALLLAGTGFGLLLAPLTELVLGLADATSIGSASIGSAVSLATAARVVGMALGLSVLTRWGLDRLLSRLAELPSPRLTSVTALVEYQRAAAAIAADVLGTLFQAGAVCAILAGVGLLVVQRGRPIVVTEDGGGIQ